MKKELIKTEVKNQKVNETKEKSSNVKKIITCRMCG